MILYRKKFNMPTNILDYIRYALYALLVVFGMLLFQAWDIEHPKEMVNQSTNQAIANTSTSNYVPNVLSSNTSTHPLQPAAQDKLVTPTVVPTSQIIHVRTDVVAADIDLVGGNITQIKLLNYPQELHGSDPVVLLNNDADTRYLSQSGLLSTAGPDTSKGQVLYTTNKLQYVLENNQNDLTVDLNWQDAKGVQVTKRFTFKRNDYEIGLSYTIHNQSADAWNGNLYLQLMRKNTPPSKSGLINLATYFGAAVSSPDKPFQKINFKDMHEKPLNETIVGGWAAMIQHYFVSAWVPPKNGTSQYFSRVTSDGLYTIGMIGPNLVVNPGQSLSTDANFYAGPSIAKRLEKVDPTLSLSIDFGWFWFIAITIFWMMQHIYNIIGNWGWSIVLVTLIIKLMFFHLSAKSYRSMSMLKKLQPRITELKERCGDDKQKFTQATLELYKKEKVNPMSGCLPILIQIPVFIGLYWVLIESVELRQAPFILWIHDLTQKDPFYVLPIMMGISMFLQQRLNPPPPDPMQAKVMMLMPVVFTALFLNFPAGLMLYWFVNNTLSFLQQWYVMRSLKVNEKLPKTNR
jgi:YidC/Oxa1 family membrane protein insertase